MNWVTWCSSQLQQDPGLEPTLASVHPQGIPPSARAPAAGLGGALLSGGLPKHVGRGLQEAAPKTVLGETRAGHFKKSPRGHGEKATEARAPALPAAQPGGTSLGDTA